MSKSKNCTNLSAYRKHICQNQLELSLIEEQINLLFVHIVNLLINSKRRNLPFDSIKKQVSFVGVSGQNRFFAEALVAKWFERKSHHLMGAKSQFYGNLILRLL